MNYTRTTVGEKTFPQKSQHRVNSILCRFTAGLLKKLLSLPCFPQRVWQYLVTAITEQKFRTAIATGSFLHVIEVPAHPVPGANLGETERS